MHLRPVVSLSILLLGLGFGSFAQVRVFAGPQLTTAAYSIKNGKQSAERKAGFAAGIGLTKPFDGPLFFAPSISFSRKGYKVRFDRRAAPPDTAALNNNTSINTIVAAPLLQLNFSDHDSRFFLRFGPAMEVAVSGKEVFDKSMNRTVSRTMQFDPTRYSRTSFSANIHFGVEAKNGVGVFANYEHGLSSLNNSDNGPVILSRAVSLSLQWTLNR